jgi:mevalonate kinase
VSGAAFRTTVPGKWVLAGEHAVLRGATAIALPHPEFRLELVFEPGRGALDVEPAAARPVIDELLLSVRDGWEADAGHEGRSFPGPEGRLRLHSTIPIGAGLGSSAALCVALSRWLADPLGIPPERRAEFARTLEHRFHGRSSGMDVAAVSAGEPISFVQDRGAERLRVRNLPRFTFHDTGLRTRTSECVYRVERFRERDPLAALRADESMGAASRLAMEGLMSYDRGDRDEGLAKLAEAMRRGQECFLAWELLPGEAKRLAEDLVRRGALAAKLTGAGGGGFVVALWPG